MSIWKRHICSFFTSAPADTPQGVFRCPICGENVTAGEIRAHAARDDERFREGLLIARIKKDHPEWVEADGACERCIEYYRQIVAHTRSPVAVPPRQRES
jgi:hypothetical protein